VKVPARLGAVRTQAGRVAVALCVAASALPAVAGADAAAAARPRVAAPSAIVVDARDGRVMLGRRVDDRRPVASATKLMTALLALERMRPHDVLPAAHYAASPIESKIDLRPGERMRVDDLLRALLLESANDAAETLAVGVSGSRARFVRLMNRRARQLKLSGTHYANPIGLDDRLNYSTARDLARLSRHLMRRRSFRTIVDLPRTTLRSGASRRTLDNRNRLVRRVPWVEGVKTGHTRGAGYVLVGAGSRRGARVITVVLGERSEDLRDRDTLRLLDHGLSAFRRMAAVRPGRPVARIPLEHGDGTPVALESRQRVVLTARRDERVTTRVSAPRALKGPLPRGARVGSITVLRAGRAVERVALVTSAAVPRPPLLARIASGASAPLTFAGSVAMVLATMLVGLRIRALRAGSGRRTRRRRTAT
jgi:D-alanyl-D-alanine carboxypeptidase (penicillin-binding protein 5/6)